MDRNNVLLTLNNSLVKMCSNASELQMCFVKDIEMFSPTQ